MSVTGKIVEAKSDVNSSQRTIIPSPKDEKDSTFNLDGRNDVDAATFLGWTNNILRSFVGANPKLAIQTLPLPEICKILGASFEWKLGQFVRKADEKPNMKLADLLEKVKSYGSFTIGTPTVVRVLEKQGIVVNSKEENTVLTFGKIIIGDDSGFGTAITYNDPVANIYNHVEIGDVLVINAGLIQKNKSDSPENVCFRQDKCLDLELKFRMFESKRVYRVEPVDRKRALEGVFPEKGTWLPTNLWNESLQDFEFPTDCRCINVCGVISFVGRVSRMEAQSKSSSDLESTKFYYCFRWIQIIDRHVSKPLSIKLFLNNLNWDQQENIVPGVSIVLTNLSAVNEKSDYFGFYLHSTLYSKVHINHDIAKVYLLPLPKKERETVRDCVSRSTCSETLQRKDVEWSAGGTLFLPILNRAGFMETYEEQVHSERPDISMAPKANLARRETQFVYVRGYIYKVMKVSRDSLDNLTSTQLYWRSDVLPNMKVYNSSESKALGRNSFLPDYDKFWFAFRRKITSLVTDRDDVFKTFEKNRILNVDLCKPLLLPSVYPKTGGPTLNTLPLVDGDTYFMVSIADPYNKCLYTCMWKSFPVTVMEKKLNEVMSLAKSKATIQENELRKDAELSKEEKENSDLHCRLHEAEQAEKLKKTSIFIIDLFRIEEPDITTGEENLQVSLVDFVNYD